MIVKLATRGSELARWQAGHVAAALRAPGVDVTVEVRVLRTTGDRTHGVPLAQIGTAGIFTREIDRAVLEGEADLAVHSLKDVPTRMEPGLVIAAVMRRADARDVFVSARGTGLRLDQLPLRCRIGTSSLRRRSLLLERRPDVRVEDLRGNLDTRLDALDRDGELDGAVLARAGLLRLGRADAATEILEPPAWLPAAGQGALAVVARADDERVLALAHRLDHEATRVCVTAERALLRQLQGGCQVPIGALATLEEGSLFLCAFVGSVDGRRIVRGHWSGTAEDAEAGGVALAAQLERNGARGIIDELREATPPIAGPSAP